MPKEYNISRGSGQCRSCGKELSPGDEFVATVEESAEEFERHDYCPSCWQSRRDERGEAGIFGLWRARVPQPEEKRKLFVDNELLINFFERLDGAEEPVRVNFRFVLALVLMRKKLLVYDRSQKLDDGREIWQMHFKGAEQAHEVINPHMDEDMIAEVSRHIGQILEGEL